MYVVNDGYLWYVEFVNVYNSLVIQKWDEDVIKNEPNRSNFTVAMQVISSTVSISMQKILVYNF